MEKKFPFWYSAEEKLEVLSFLPDHLRERTDRKLMRHPWRSSFLFRASVPENPGYRAEN